MTAILDWLNTPAFTAFGAPTSWAEVLGFLTGLATVYLVARKNVWNWPVGIANASLWIVLFGGAGLYADASLQVVYIVLGLWGWWMWLHVGTKRIDRQITRTSRKEWMGLIAAGVAGTLFLVWFLDTQTGSTVPWADGATTAISLMAVYGQSKKKLESWYLWILADMIYIPLYQYKGLTLTAILYVGFAALCVYGLIGWRKDLLAREQAALMPDAPTAPRTPAPAGGAA
jgi:nicotinamide mononucleotide transporter